MQNGVENMRLALVLQDCVGIGSDFLACTPLLLEEYDILTSTHSHLTYKQRTMLSPNSFMLNL